jgi:hypothetical protein
MDRALVRCSAEPPTQRAHVPVELCIGREIIDVWLDDQGIHFRQEGASASEGVLPWGVAIAMSLLPPGLPRMPTATAV